MRIRDGELHHIVFRLQDRQYKKILDIGYLIWPFRVKRVQEPAEGIVEVTDSEGVATFSLDDITIADLWSCR